MQSLADSCFFLRLPTFFAKSEVAAVTPPSSPYHPESAKDTVGRFRSAQDAIENRLRVSTPLFGVQKARKTVSFDCIQLRYYLGEIGDHPACSSGCPITLSWDYTNEERVDIDEYEASKRFLRPPIKVSRITCYERRRMLSSFSDWEILRAERELYLERRRQRRALVSNRFMTTY